MELADRVAVIFDGKLAQYDAPDALYQRPDSVEIADFMGASNIFRCADLRTARRQRLSALFSFSTDTMPVRDGAGRVLLRGEAIDLLD